MQRILLVLVSLVLCLGLYAQWSTNAANPNQIYNGTNAQVMPKTAVTNDGKTWIAWMDNTSGNYNTYAQLLDFMGAPVFTTPVLVSNHTTMSWLTEWDVDSDPYGNLILCFQDLRNVTNNVVIYKLTQTGDFPWGLNGIMLSNDTDDAYSNMSPVVQCLSDGRTIAAWQRMTGTTSEIRLQSLAAAEGDLEWSANGIQITSTTARYTWPQLRDGLDGNVLVKYYEDTGPVWAPTRHMLMLSYDDNGFSNWTNPVVIQGLGGISAWNQLIGFAPDGAGGAVLTWHDDRNGVNISYTYVQHVTLAGIMTMQPDGAPVSLETGYHQFYPRVNINTDTQEIYIFWNRVSGNQDMWGLQMQKLSLSGERLWGDNGMSFITLGNYPTYPLRAGKMGDNMVFLYSISPEINNDQVATIKAYAVSGTGQPMWAGGLGDIAATNSHKLHFDSDVFGESWGVVTWEDGAGPSFTCAMRFNHDGSLGTILPAPHILTGEVINQNDVFLDWVMPAVALLPVGYNVYRNDELYHLVSAAATQDTIFGLGPGQWSFHVTAVFEGGDESAPSNTVIVNITGSQVETPTPMINLTADPNPFRENVCLNVKNLMPAQAVLFSVYNAKGQLICREKLNGHSEINWTWDGRNAAGRTVPSGLYLARLTQGDQRFIIKLLKR